MARARSIVLWLLTIEVAVLVVTGVYLYFFYRPDASSAWSDIETLHNQITFGLVVRDIHHWTSRLTVLTAIVAGVLLAVRAHRSESVPRGVLLGGGVALGVAAASFTGFLLPWDQLALWQVTVGTNMMGYKMVWGDQVRFALLGGTEIAISTLRKWLILHIALGLSVAGLTALGWRRTRRGVPDGDPDIGPGAPTDEGARLGVPVGV